MPTIPWICSATLMAAHSGQFTGTEHVNENDFTGFPVTGSWASGRISFTVQRCAGNVKYTADMPTDDLDDLTFSSSAGPLHIHKQRSAPFMPALAGRRAGALTLRQACCCASEPSCRLQRRRQPGREGSAFHCGAMRIIQMLPVYSAMSLTKRPVAMALP